jgi:hypothetical protein
MHSSKLPSPQRHRSLPSSRPTAVARIPASDRSKAPRQRLAAITPHSTGSTDTPEPQALPGACSAPPWHRTWAATSLSLVGAPRATPRLRAAGAWRESEMGRLDGCFLMDAERRAGCRRGIVSLFPLRAHQRTNERLSLPLIVTVVVAVALAVTDPNIAAYFVERSMECVR